MTDSFLRQHASALSSVRDRTTLAEWHANYAGDWCARAAGLAASANKAFALTGERVIRDEVGYLAVESANPDQAQQTWILLSANPGWSEEVNRIERAKKGQAADNTAFDVGEYQSFRQAFFPRWYSDCIAPVNARRGQWWNKALNLLHDCAELPRAAGMAQRDPRLDVIGWELWPMHSSEDGLSALARGADHVLARFARASIEAALRFQGTDATPIGGVLLASTVGYDLLARMEVPGLAVVEQRACDGIQVRRYWHEGTGRSLFAVRRQLFAGWGSPTNDQRAALLGWILAAGHDSAPTPIVPAPEPAPPAEDEAAERIYELVEDVLGVACGCETGSQHCCPRDCHTWRRAGDAYSARVMVRRPGRGGMVHLCIPTKHGPAFVGEVGGLPGVGNPTVDGRSPNIWRIGLKPNLDNEAHVTLLKTWLPRTIA
jgi:hypothetical protein